MTAHPAHEVGKRKIKPSGLGAEFDNWWANYVRDDYKNHISETVAKAAWVTAWNVGRRAHEVGKEQG